MATIQTMPFSKWWRSIKRKPVEQQREIFTKWLHYACKTISHRGDMNQAKIVYTIATRFNKSEYKRMTKSNAAKVYRLVNLKQQTHRAQAQEIRELHQRIADLEAQQAKQRSGNQTARNVADAIKRDNKNVKISVKKTRKIIHGGNV